MPAAPLRSVGCGTSLRLVLDARPPLKWWLCKAREHASVATSADEQAVSMLMQAPCMPRTNEMRPAAIEPLLPVPAYAAERAP